MCNKISSSPTPQSFPPAMTPPAAQGNDPLAQLQQILGGNGGPTDMAGLKRLIRQLDRSIVEKLLQTLGGASPAQGACGGAMPAGAALPGAIPVGTRGEQVQAKVNEAAQRLQAATGINVPTQVIDDGQVNGRAGTSSNVIQTGIPVDAVPGAKFHEDAHVLNGDAATGGSTTDKELRADEGAGYLLVKAGYGQKEIAAYAQVAAATAGADHGTPEQRVQAVQRGVMRALQGG